MISLQEAQALQVQTEAQRAQQAEQAQQAKRAAEKLQQRQAYFANHLKLAEFLKAVEGVASGASCRYNPNEIELFLPNGKRIATIWCEAEIDPRGWRPTGNTRITLRPALADETARRYTVKGSAAFNFSKAAATLTQWAETLVAATEYAETAAKKLAAAEALHRRVSIALDPINKVSKVSVSLKTVHVISDPRRFEQHAIAPQLTLAGLTEEQVLQAVQALQAAGILPTV